MQFYALAYRLDAPLWKSKEEEDELSGQKYEEKEKRRFFARMSLKSDRFNAAHKQEATFYPSLLAEKTMLHFCAVVFTEKGKRSDVSALFDAYSRALGLCGSLEACTETSLQSFASALQDARRSGAIPNEDAILEELGVKMLLDFGSMSVFPERVPDASYGEADAAKRAKELLCAQEFQPELARIFSPSAPTDFMGHPVQYMLTAYAESREAMRELLIASLYHAGRLLSRHCFIIDPYELRESEQSHIRDAYEMSRGGTVILCMREEEDDGRFRRRPTTSLSSLVEIIKEYRRSVLTVIECDAKNTAAAERMAKALHGIKLIHLQERPVFRQEAKRYLKARAAEVHISRCTALYKRLGNKERSFYRHELDTIFDSWYDHQLCTHVYRAYSGVAAEYDAHKEKPRGDAAKELSEMIGLTEPKRLVREALDFAKMQKLFADKGFSEQHPTMHMVFTGNPGTAKTTVARLFAQIMKDNGVLSEGRLIEVGRADLTGKYVGWTAQIVKEKFRQARGSVLFIDEAYSLLDYKHGLYGDEAINTIVQEMENNRNDTIVIFAGYPDEMRDFIGRNPGLKSRIAFEVDFPDYNVQELMDIFSLMLKSKDRSVDDIAAHKVRAILDQAVQAADFGNGRYVRSLVEKAMLRQASRLAQMDPENITRYDCEWLSADDFPEPAALKTKEMRLIGF